MVDEVLLNKAATIERCVARIQAEYEGKEQEFDTNFTQQDAVVLNIQRAVQAAVDMATHVVRTRKLGVPQSGREVFKLLSDAGLLEEKLSENLQKMVGFRNIAVHDYQTLNLDIVKKIIKESLQELILFKNNLLQN